MRRPTFSIRLVAVLASSVAASACNRAGSSEGAAGTDTEGGESGDGAEIGDSTGGPPDIPPGTPCPWPQVLCDGACVDPTADAGQCGGCGVVCDGGRACVDGTCVTGCDGLPVGAAIGIPSPYGSDKGNYISVRAADLDLDGHMDVVVRASEHVYAQLGAGDGTLGDPRPSITLDAYGTRQWVADLDGDQVPDLVAQSGMDVALARGVGDGTFETPVVALADLELYGVADFDGTGGSDLLVRDNPPRLGIALGIGDGTFAAPVYSTEIPYTYEVAMADLDRDGDLDVVYAEDDLGRIAWMPGDGSGGLGAPQGIMVDTAYTDRLEWLNLMVAAGPFTAADHADVVVTVSDFGQTAPSEQFVYRADAGGTLVEVARSTLPEVSWQRGVDLDDDGRLELLTFDRNGTVSDLDGDGFARRTYALYAGAGVNTGHDKGDLADFDGDGALDLVTGAQWENDGVVTVVVHAAHGPGALSAARLWSPWATQVAVADLDGDGFDDIVGGNAELGVVFGGAAGAYDPVALGATVVSAPAAIGDVDVDGDLDFVVTGDDAIILFRNQGARSFGAEMIADVDADAVSIGDVNDDGHPDIVAGSVAYLGPAFSYAHSVSTHAILALADLDGDGLVDALDEDGSLHNLGDGNFEAWAGYPNSKPREIAIADLDGDGVWDLVARAQWPVAGLGMGDGSFVNVTGLGGGVDDPDVLPAVVDLDGDGRDEVVTLRAPYSTEVMPLALVHRLQGTELVEVATVPLAPEPRGLSAGDVDGDGVVDLVTTYTSVADGPAIAVLPLGCP